MTLQVQFLTMVSMIIGGFYLGMARDTYLRFSPYWRQRIILRYVLEIAFWMIQTILLFYILYRVNAGELRAYIFIACLLGVSIYKVFFASLYKKVLELMIRLLLMIYRIFREIIRVVVVIPIKGIVYFILLMFQFVFTVLFFIIKLILPPFKWIVIFAFSLLPKKLQKIIRNLVGFYSIMTDTSKKWIKNILSKRR